MDEIGDRKWVSFGGRILIIGFGRIGRIGRGVLPLLLRHVELRPDRVTVLAIRTAGRALAEAYGVAFAAETITAANYRTILDAHLESGDFLLNLSIHVCSLDLIVWCREHGYLDGYFDTSLSPSQRSKYALREAVRALRGQGETGPTAVLTHGVNPGLVSHLVKVALLDLGRDLGIAGPEPDHQAGWRGCRKPPG